MAGAKGLVFREHLTPYIRTQLDSLEATHGVASSEYRALSLQYLKSPLEDEVTALDRMRHYQAGVCIRYEGAELRGVERLYRRTLLVQPTMACAAHCRWCLRGQYPVFTLSNEEITRVARYAGSDTVRDDLREVLVTGGDALIIPEQLRFLLTQFQEHAPNIRVFRLGTRIPLQDPRRVDAALLSMLESFTDARIEIATHINHPVELTKEARGAFRELSSVVDAIYDQTVLLKGTNDSVDTLSTLFDELRYLGIEAHYLFHCIPMRGMSHHRTTVQAGLELVAALTNSGIFSGRAKPRYTVMTDIGKITLAEGTILDRNGRDELLLQSRYTADNFRAYNPSWVLPSSAHEDERGFLRVWYPDGDSAERALSLVQLCS
jgi:lysine 2,3-aminomutase